MILHRKLNVQIMVDHLLVREIQTSLKISTHIILKMIKLILIWVIMPPLILVHTVQQSVSDDANAKLDSWEVKVVSVSPPKQNVDHLYCAVKTKNWKISVMDAMIKLAIMWFQRKSKANRIENFWNRGMVTAVKERFWPSILIFSMYR